MFLNKKCFYKSQRKKSAIRFFKMGKEYEYTAHRKGNTEGF